MALPRSKTPFEPMPFRPDSAAVLRALPDLNAQIIKNPEHPQRRGAAAALLRGRFPLRGEPPARAALPPSTGWPNCPRRVSKGSAKGRVYSFSENGSSLPW